MEGRYVDGSAVNVEVSVRYKLTRLTSRNRYTHSVNHVVKSSLEKNKHVFTRDTFHSIGFLVVISELRFEDAVNSLSLLFFTKLKSVFGNLLSVCSVLSGRYRSFFERTRSLVALVAF